MPPKKSKAPPKNAFYFFMMDWKAEMEGQGQRFSGLKEVAELCSENWKDLPESDKKYYKDKEMEAKQTKNNDLGSKFNSLGVAFDVIDRQKQEEAEALVKMHRHIESDLLTHSSSIEALKNHCFYLAHANVYCYWGQKKIYIPCELAISKFNLKEGLVDTYHVFPGPCTETKDIPIGYRYEVVQNSNTVHGIPEPSEFDKLNNDWGNILTDILKFMRADENSEVPPVYTFFGDDTNFNCHLSAVIQFFEYAAGDSGVQFRVYDLTHLFFKLYESCQQLAVKFFNDSEVAFLVESLAHQQLTKDVYNFCTGICCDFHEQTDHYHNCSLSFVRRWVFLICEFCCQALRLPLILGRHCPIDAKITSTSGKTPCTGNLTYEDTEDNDNEDGAWSTVPKLQHGMKNLVLETKGNSSLTVPRNSGNNMQGRVQNSKVERRKTDQEDLILIDRSKVPDPKQARILKTGQTANVVSELMPEAGPSVRLPNSRGRGELMAQMLLKQQTRPGAVFTADDFPAIGANRPGRLAKPIGSSWGRGMQP